MATEDQPSGGCPLKVFLWATPRSVSTTFLKCMTFVPETSAWHEPYFQMAKFASDDSAIMFDGHFKRLLERLGGQEALDKIDAGFDSSDKTIDWLKEQLEGDFPGKKLVFVKDIAAAIARPSPPRFDKLPKGFRHTFIMRHPRNVINMKSFLKRKQQGQSKPDSNGGAKPSTTTTAGPKLPQNITPDKVRPYQYLNELWKHVIAQDLDAKPIIIDADDLLRNPKAVLEAYCKELGIPFSEELLTWEAGDEVMTKHWVVPKQAILSYRMIGAHNTTFASTGFTPPAKPDIANAVGVAKEGNTHDKPAVAPEMIAKAQQMIESIMRRELPLYEEMYAQRLVVDTK